MYFASRLEIQNYNEHRLTCWFNEVVLKPKPKNLADAFNLLTEMPSDFMDDRRNDPVPQERENF